MYHNEQFEIFVQVSMDYIRCLKNTNFKLLQGMYMDRQIEQLYLKMCGFLIYLLNEYASNLLVFYLFLESKNWTTGSQTVVNTVTYKCYLQN